MTESKVRMFVINNSNNVTIKSCEVNIDKETDFEFLNIDEKSNVVLENNEINIKDE